MHSLLCHFSEGESPEPLSAHPARSQGVTAALNTFTEPRFSPSDTGTFLGLGFVLTAPTQASSLDKNQTSEDS